MKLAGCLKPILWPRRRERCGRPQGTWCGASALGTTAAALLMSARCGPLRIDFPIGNLVILPCLYIHEATHHQTLGPRGRQAASGRREPGLECAENFPAAWSKSWGCHEAGSRTECPTARARPSASGGAGTSRVTPPDAPPSGLVLLCATAEPSRPAGSLGQHVFLLANPPLLTSTRASIASFSCGCRCSISMSRRAIRCTTRPAAWAWKGLCRSGSPRRTDRDGPRRRRRRRTRTRREYCGSRRVKAACPAPALRRPPSDLSVIKCFETDGGVNYRSDRLI
jgi:hypothetical protein